MNRLLPLLVTIVAICTILLSLMQLRAAQDGIRITDTELAHSPATIYQSTAPSDLLVVISHGFAGSQQMMEQISLSLAKAGHTVVAFDYLGHGRHTRPLSPNITTLTGTTADLVQQTLDVVRTARANTGKQRVALIGHSMATDVIIRAAEELEDVTAVVAISMYSEAVTPTHPERLLILSGAQETRLRAVARETLAQLGDTREGITVQRDQVTRRAAVAPYVGHVGVLWSPTTSTEILRWVSSSGASTVTGPWIAGLLAGIFALFWPLSRLMQRAALPTPPSLRRAVLSVVVPVPFAILGSFINLPFRDLSGFGALFLFFSLWGLVGLAVLRWRPTIDVKLSILSALMLVMWGLGAFALALDTYGAAFVPTGPRLPLMVALLPAMLVFALADRAYVHGRHWLIRIVLRLPVVVALLGAMLLNVADIGLLFTVLPVLVLFWVVYGTMAHWAARAAGPVGPALASGVILAWAIAASTPLFATS